MYLARKQAGLARAFWQRLLVMAVAMFLHVGGSASIFAATVEIDFNRDVRPILSDKCFACHGPDASHREADLRLDREEDAKADRDGQAAITPGSDKLSQLWQRITSNDDDQRMPPVDSGKELTLAERDTLQKWILAGAPWSAHWAYVSPHRSELPELQDRPWAQNFIDSFVLAKLEQHGLAANPIAEPVSLLRRLSFDLTGLPPTWERVQVFAHAPRRDTYEQLVDEMLATPAFGERMAIFWLDLVRYADTVGYHGDQDHNISPYRDYVIDAFNDNLPFDQFSREQLAGDLLPDADVRTQIASGYNRMLQTSHEGGIQPKEYLAIYAADRVRNVAAAWLGGTLGCAQCHDHKFDPYSSHDFYSMAAFFADVDEESHFTTGSNELPTKRAPEQSVLMQRERQRLEDVDRALQSIEHQIKDSESLSPSQRSALTEQRKMLTTQRSRINMQQRTTMVTRALETPRTIRVLPRGNWLDDSGPIVVPAVPAFLGKLAIGERRANRLDLANWLTDSHAGIGMLTARVFVNRVWALYFGGGLCPSLDDFGAQGQTPHHPELLDQLACEFVDQGWDVKWLVRTIVTSNTYQQSSQATPQQIARDPQNIWLSRQVSYRLPAEMIRDNALSVSNLLNQEVGGPSIKPYQPAEYYRHLNFPTRTYQHDTDAQQWRRGVYVHWQRQFLHPMLRAFDAPTREECTASRSRSNTPLAALVLLNDPTYVEAARALATRALRDSTLADDPARMDEVFRQALSRGPDEFERQHLLRLLDRSRQAFAANPTAADQLLHVGLDTPEIKLEAIELAAWTAATRAILNLHEFVMRP